MRVSDLAAALRDEFCRNTPDADAPMESTNELAERFGVAAMTADRAIRKLVEEGVLYRSKGRGTFFRAAPRKSTVPLVVYSAWERYSIPEMRIRSELAIATLRQAGGKVKFVPPQVLRSVAEGRRELAEADGVLLSGEIFDPEVSATLESYRKPVVLFGKDYVCDETFHQVGLNFAPVFRGIVKRIRSEVRTHKVIVLREPHSNGMFRAQEFLRFWLAAGGTEEELDVRTIAFGDGMFRVVETLRQVDVAGRFIFSTSDLVSEVLLHTAEARGLEAGREFELVSCDNLAPENFSGGKVPALTTVNCLAMEVAETAAKLLLELIPRPFAYPHVIRIPAELIIRKSAWSV